MGWGNKKGLPPFFKVVRGSLQPRPPARWGLHLTVSFLQIFLPNLYSLTVMWRFRRLLSNLSIYCLPLCWRFHLFSDAKVVVFQWKKETDGQKKHILLQSLHIQPWKCQPDSKNQTINYSDFQQEIHNLLIRQAAARNKKNKSFSFVFRFSLALHYLLIRQAAARYEKEKSCGFFFCPALALHYLCHG